MKAWKAVQFGKISGFLVEEMLRRSRVDSLEQVELAHNPRYGMMKPLNFRNLKRDVMNGADISSRLDMEDEQM